MPYVLTPWLAPLGGFDHDAATNVAFAALWGRLAQYSEREGVIGLATAGYKLGQWLSSGEPEQVWLRSV